MSTVLDNLPRLAAYAGGGTIGPGKPRDPLPPFDRDTIDHDNHDAPLPVYATLWHQSPKGPDIRYWRGDAWGVTVPGLPEIPGGADGPAARRVLSWFLDRYARVDTAWEGVILDAHAERGYTHFDLSPQDSFAMGLSLSQYVAMAERVKSRGFFVHHLIRSKLFTPEDADPAGAAFIVRALLEAGVLDIHTPAWEGNYNSPDGLRRIIDHDAELIQGRTRTMLHFFPHYISWQRNGEAPGSFWNANAGKVHGVCYQHVPDWSAGMMAARLNDCLTRLKAGGTWGLSYDFDLTSWEVTASQQFNNDRDGDGRIADEDHGCLKGYQNLCTPGPMPVMGYGNGGRRVNGDPL